VDIGVITLFPEMFSTLRSGGVTARAIERGLVQVALWNPRDYTQNKHRRVDDRPFGGGPGMVMQAQPLRCAIRAARQAQVPHSRVIYLSPQGRLLNRTGLEELVALPGLILVAGRYGGIDERLLHTDIDEEWSIGDYVLSGGELAAMVLIDALARLLPGALGHEDSNKDSFTEGLLEAPQYTRPERLDDLSVPAVLLSGHHAAIQRWRAQQALGRTWLKRPDLLQHKELTAEQKILLQEFITAYQRGTQS